MKSKVLVVGTCRIENILYSKIYPLEDSELDTDIDEEFRIGGIATDVCRALRTLQNTPSLLSTVPKVNRLFDRYLPDVGIDTTLCDAYDGRPAWSTIVVNEGEDSITSFHYAGELPRALESSTACNLIKDLSPGFSWVHIEGKSALRFPTAGSDMPNNEDAFACLRELRQHFDGDVKISASAIPENGVAWLHLVDYVFVDCERLRKSVDEAAEALVNSAETRGPIVIAKSNKEILALSSREEVRVKCSAELTTRERLRSYADFVGSAIHFLASGLPPREALHSLINDIGSIRDMD